MRLAIAVLAVLVVSPAMATEDYVCRNHNKPYPLSFDRDAKSLTIDGEKADVEHMVWASQVVEIRGTVNTTNMFFWAELDNKPTVEWMKDQKIIRVDQCRYVDKPLD